MGVGASTNKVTQENNIISSSYAKCPNVSVGNILDISNLIHKPNPACKKSSFVINQKAGVEADCLLNSMQKNLAETLSKQDAKVQGGLGFQFSTNVNNLKNQIETKLEASCGNRSTTNKANISDTYIGACDFKYVAEASDKSSCEINLLQDTSSKLINEQKAEAEGLTLASFLLGYGLFSGIIMLIIIIVVIVVIIKAAKGGAGKLAESKIAAATPQGKLAKVALAKGGSFSGDNIFIAFLIIVFLSIIFVGIYVNKKKELQPSYITINGKKFITPNPNLSGTIIGSTSNNKSLKGADLNNENPELLINDFGEAIEEGTYNNPFESQIPDFLM